MESMNEKIIKEPLGLSGCLFWIVVITISINLLALIIHSLFF